MDIWWYILLALLAMLAIVFLVLYFAQDRFVHHGVTLHPSHQFHFNQEFEELFLDAEDGTRQNAVLFHHKNAQGTVLYCHNHSGNIESWAQVATVFEEMGMNTLLIDYRGYGKSEGQFREKKVFSDLDLWYDLLKESVAEEKISIYGRGIGSVMASYLAAKHQPAALILESPLYTLRYTAKRFLPWLPYSHLISRYKFDNAGFFSSISCPILIMHGKQNKLLHYSSSQKLHALKPEESELLLIEGADHYDLFGRPEVLEKLESWLRK